MPEPIGRAAAVPEVAGLAAAPAAVDPAVAVAVRPAAVAVAAAGPAAISDLTPGLVVRGLNG